MPKVFVVFADVIDAQMFEGVFASKQAAETYIAKVKPENQEWPDFYIREVEIQS